MEFIKRSIIIFLISSIMVGFCMAEDAGIIPMVLQHGMIYRFADMGSKSKLSFPVPSKFEYTGDYNIYVFSDGAWTNVAKIPSDKHFRVNTLDLSSWIKKDAIKLRIEKSGVGSGHIDSFLLDGKPPVITDKKMLLKLSVRDYDVVDASKVAREWTFKTDSGMKGIFEVSARIEPEILKEIPFQYPIANMYTKMDMKSTFYKYRLASKQNTLKIDGELKGEKLGTPFFNERYIVGSGHPQGSTYGWVSDNGDALYIAMDIPCDNTMDGELDYAKVYAKTRAGIKEFKITTREKEWGDVGFTYTNAVSWEHKVYEFKIPFTELEALQGEDLELAFAVYGTCEPPNLAYEGPATLDPDSNGVQPNSGPSGTTFKFVVEYSYGCGVEPLSSQVWIDLDEDGNIDDVSGVVSVIIPKIPPGIAAVIMLVIFVLSILIMSRRKKLAPVFLIFTLLFVLSSCPPEQEMTVDEVYNMTTEDSTFAEGAVYTADVTLHAEPGTYNFKFVFVDDEGNQLNDEDGEAAGILELAITEE